MKHGKEKNAIIIVRNITKKTASCPNINDIEKTDPAILSDSFLSFSQRYLWNSAKIESKIVLASKKYTEYLTNPSEKFFFLRPTADEIEDIIKKTKYR